MKEWVKVEADTVIPDGVPLWVYSGRIWTDSSDTRNISFACWRNKSENFISIATSMPLSRITHFMLCDMPDYPNINDELNTN